MHLSRFPRGVFVLLPFLVPVSCAILYAQIPPNPDQMELNYAGWRMLHGERPYVDVLSCNWPGSLWMHMGAIAIFGNTLSAWRIADALLMLATVAGVAWFLRSTFDALTAAIFVVFYPVLFYAGGWLTGQRDFVATHLILLAAAFHWKAWTSGNWRWQIGAGLCVGYAGLIKPPFFLSILVLLAAGLVMGRSRLANRRERISQSISILLTIAVFVVLCGVFLLEEGTPLARFWEIGIQFHLDAYSQAKLPVGARIGNLLTWLAVPWWWLTALALISPTRFVRIENRRTTSLVAYGEILSFFLLSLGSYVWQGQGLMYQASGIYVCLVLFALLSVAAVAREAWAASRVLRLSAGALSLCFLLGIASRLETYYWPPLEFLVGRIDDREFYSRFTAGGLNVWEALSFARTIRAEKETRPESNQTILVWSLANVINNEAGCRNATRFHTPPVLLLAHPPFEAAAEWRREFVADVAQSNPFACVVESPPFGDPADESVKFVQRLMRERYRAVAKSQRATLYLRRDAQ
jgi:hypothetical protein